MTPQTPAKWLLAGGVAAGVTSAAWAVTGSRSPTDSGWRRRNFRDRSVSLLLGPAIGAGAVAGVAAAGPPGRRSALAVVASAAVVGIYDDLYGDRHARGLSGHARALASGRVTTGMVKLVSLTSAAALTSFAAHRRPADVVIGTVLVAGGANLINLFDLRPGRAAKVAVLAAIGVGWRGNSQGRVAAAAAAGSALAALPSDLGERAMLGDCGAGTLGALLGWSAVTIRSRRSRGTLAAIIVALTLASERLSFSAMIDRNPVLRGLDQFGRAPA